MSRILARSPIARLKLRDAIVSLKKKPDRRDRAFDIFDRKRSVRGTQLRLSRLSY
ncbi:hypothetical protein [Phormidesmis sp. 146-33]